MHTTTNKSALPSLPPLPLPKPRATRSPYPVTRKPMAPVTPARKAYRQLKSMISNLKSTKTSQVATTLGMYNGTKCGQLAPGHQNSSRAQPHEMTIQVDEFYGWAQVAKTSARFISTLLNFPETLLSTDPGEAHPDLAHYIAFSLHHSRLPLCVHQYALHLVWRVRCLSPEFQPKHAHGTYLTALMLAAKQSHDGVYSLNDWVTIGQDIFERSQLRGNEWRMCERLGWNFLVHPMDLVKLAWTVELEYGELDEGVPASSDIAPETGLGGMFTASVASSLSSLSSSSSHSLNSPWSGWGETTSSGSSISTPGSHSLACDSSSSSPFSSA